jgi:hypothetical protein
VLLTPLGEGLWRFPVVPAAAVGYAGHNTGIQKVDVYPKSPERLTPLIGAERAERLRFAVQEARQAIDGATVWHINATAHGGGVAEILTSTLLDGGQQRSQGPSLPPTQTPHGRSSTTSPTSNGPRSKPLGWMGLRSDGQAAAARLCAPTVSRRAIHARKRRAGLPLLQHQ